MSFPWHGMEHVPKCQGVLTAFPSEAGIARGASGSVRCTAITGRFAEALPLTCAAGGRPSYRSCMQHIKSCCGCSCWWSGASRCVPTHEMTFVQLWICLPSCEAHCSMRTGLAGCEMRTGSAAEVTRLTQHQGMLCCPAFALTSSVGARLRQF